jgi:hypothetical protein
MALVTAKHFKMLRRTSLLSMWLLLTLFSFADSQPQNQQPPRQERSENAQADKGNSNAGKQQTSVLEIECDPTCAAKNSKENGTYDRITRLSRKLLDDPLAILTGALVLVVLCQLRDARKSSKQQLRAYVFGNGGSITLVAPSPGGDMQIHVTYRFKNFGHTPAYKASMWTRVEIFDADAPVFSQHTGLGNFAIGPGANSESQLGRLLTHPELDDIRAEKKAIFVWGEIKYVDAFGKRRYFRFYDRNDGIEIPGKGWPIANSNKPYEAN